jgi:hypothetical protein
MSMILRECQVNAIDSINKNQNGIIEMCCGSGKSLVISEIIKQYKVSVLFVPKNALFEQFVDNAFYSGFNFILINCKNDTQGSIDYNKNNVILTNMSSFHVLKKYISNNDINIDFIAYDEAHLYTSVKKRNNIEEIDVDDKDKEDFDNGALNIECKQIFFTATPNKILKENPDIFGEIIYRYSYAQGVLDKIVVPIDVVFGYTKKNLSDPVDDYTMNQTYITFMTDLVKSYSLKRVIFYTSFVSKKDNTNNFRTYLKSFQKLLKNNKDFTYHFIESSTTQYKRKQILDDFNGDSDTIQVIFTCKTMSEGIDCKSCDAVILADPSKSIPSNVQKALRCDRTNGIKQKGIVGIPIFLNSDDMNNFLNKEDKQEYISQQSNGHLYNYQVLLLNMLKNDMDLDILYEYKINGDEIKLKDNLKVSKTKETVEKLTQEIAKLVENKLVLENKPETSETKLELKEIQTELETKQETLEELTREKEININQRAPCKVLMNFHDAYSVEYDIKEFGKSVEVSLNIQPKITLSIDEVFHELLEIKNQGKKVNTMSKEMLSNGNQVGSWLGRCKDKLSQVQLEQLDLHDKVLSVDEVFAELIEMKTQGKKVNNKSKELLRNNVQVKSWLIHNRYKLTQEQLESLDLHDKVLSIDEGFEELVKIKRQGKKIIYGTNELLSNGTKVSAWMTKNKPKLSQEQLEQLDLHDKSLTIDEAFYELLEMKKKGKKTNSKSKERFSNGIQVGNWVNIYKSKLTPEQLKELDLSIRISDNDEIQNRIQNRFNELLEMNIQVNGRTTEKFTDGAKIGPWFGTIKKHLTKEQLDKLNIKTPLSKEDAFNEIFYMKKDGKKVNSSSIELLSNGNKVKSWLDTYKKTLSQEQLDKLEIDKPISSNAKEKKRCTQLLVSGKNKGTQCSKNATIGSLCTVHNKKKIVQEPVEEIKKNPNVKPKTAVDEEKTKRESTQMSEEELQAFYVKTKMQNQSGYTAPNPLAKSEINELFANSLNMQGKGKVIVLDDIDFNSANSVYKSGISLERIVIPNNDPLKNDKMSEDKVFGKCVVKCSLQELLDGYNEEICGVYADLMGQEFYILDSIKKCNLGKGCIIGFTVSARSNKGAIYTNDYTNKLLNKMYSSFSSMNPENLVEDSGILVYGKDAQMATSIFKVN